MHTISKFVAELSQIIYTWRQKRNTTVLDKFVLIRISAKKNKIFL
jgi:hypothetical protein